MKFSVIIPVSKKDNKFLKRAIHSIIEQDYQDREIIVVGHKDNKSEKISNRYKIAYYDCDSPNGSIKRNLGFDKSRGDVVLFFDCDCILLPGMLRLFKDTFEDHPDCSFIYGAYRYNVDSLNVFPSRPYEPYLLETTNYISTMSPMKREIFPRFNEVLEFFQDWDLFIRIAKAGHKGFFLKDVIFITEVSDKESVSGNPKTPYLDKVEHIRRINNIPYKPICVSTLGAPYQAIERAKILNADYYGIHQNSTLVQIPSMFSHKYKMIYVVGFYPLALDDHARIFSNAPKECLKVIQWIGTDVFQLRTRFNWESIKYIKEKILKHVDVQLCNSLSLEKELGEVGIKANTLYMPLIGEFRTEPLPEKFTVGIYYSDTNLMHNEQFMIDVAKSMPDVEFKFFGGSKQAKDENIEYIPWGDITDIIRQCSINVRITLHDGFPHIPIQFLLSGRQVITNFDMPHVEYLPVKVTEETYGETKVRVIEKIREVKNKPSLAEVAAANIYYREIGDPKKFKDIIYMILEKGKDYIFKDIEEEKCHIQQE